MCSKFRSKKMRCTVCAELLTVPCKKYKSTLLMCFCKKKYDLSGIEYSDDIAQNRVNFGIFEIAYWLKLNYGQHLTLHFLSIRILGIFKKFY